MITRGRRLLLAVLQRVEQRDLAARCGVTQQTVSAWATGVKRPSVAARLRLELGYRIPRGAWDALPDPRAK